MTDQVTSIEQSKRLIARGEGEHVLGERPERERILSCGT